MGKIREKSMLVLGEKKMILRCSWQPASEMRPCTPSAEEGAHEFLKYVVESEILKDRLESIRAAEKRRSAWKGSRGTYV